MIEIYIYLYLLKVGQELFRYGLAVRLAMCFVQIILPFISLFSTQKYIWEEIG